MGLYLDRLTGCRVQATIGILIVALLVMGCGDSPTTPAAPSQEDIDSNVGYGITCCFTFIWNQNIAGTSSGPIDITVPGPQGGTVHIYGTTSNNGDIQICDLILEMLACESSNTYYDLALTGSLHCSGSWSDDYKAMSYLSDLLTFVGTVTISGTTIEVDETGTIAITATLNSLSGEICGRPFAY